MSDVDLWQLGTVALFLGALLTAWYLVTRNKTALAGKLAGDRKMRLTETLALGPGERALLLSVDGRMVMLVTGKRGPAQLLELSANPTPAEGRA